MKFFITGSAGFIGSHISRVLYPDHEVKRFDIAEKNGDVLDPDWLMDAMPDGATVIHCAAIAGIYKTSADMTRTLAVNLIGTHNVIGAALAHKARLFVNFSTSEVYGPHIWDGRETDMTTQGPIDEPRWGYSVSKLAGEYLAKASGLPYLNIRPFNIFGPGQVGEGAIHDMIVKALADDPITVYNDGTQIRSWCYIVDFVRALMGLIDGDHTGTYNIGNPQNTITVLSLAREIIELAGSRSQIVMAPHPGPEVHVRVPNIEKLKKATMFEPLWTLEVGLIETIRHYRGIR